jgi:hypothetical protein
VVNDDEERASVKSFSVFSKKGRREFFFLSKIPYDLLPHFLTSIFMIASSNLIIAPCSARCPYSITIFFSKRFLSLSLYVYLSMH